MTNRLFATLAAALITPVALSEPVAIDGRFDDWSPRHIVAIDPAGDATGVFDVTRLKAQSHGSVVFLRFDTGRVLNIQSGPREEGTLIFNFRHDPSGQSIELNVRARSVHRIDADGSRTEIGWYPVGYRSAPTFAHHEFEFRVDLSPIGASTGDQITLTLSGSDELDAPVQFTLAPAVTAELEPRSIERAPGTSLRVASLNTWRNGMVDPERSAPLLRLLKGVAPDVIMLQEEYNTSSEQINAAITSAFGGQWNLVKVRDNVIATQSPLTQLTSLDDSYAAAVMPHDTLGQVLLMTVHHKCCGTIGSEEDTRRIAQTRAMIQTIELARSRFGDDITVVLAGDWNLVGSRSPLDMLTSPVGPALHHVDARHLRSNDTYTWFAPNSNFSPGMLDLIAVDAESSRSRAVLVDSRKLSPEQLRKAGLRPEDSEASDHLMLVLDLIR